MIHATQHVNRDGAPRLALWPPAPRSSKGRADGTTTLVKRAIDVTVASLLLVLLSPLLAAVATAVKFDSPGPVLFVHERVGTRRVRRRGRVVLEAQAV